jgi:type I restriction enzyme S subunit
VKATWPIKPLAEVCQIKPPKAEARRRISESDLVSFVPMEDLGIDQKLLIPTRERPLAEVNGSYTYFADGDVLLAKITPCFENGKLGIAANLTNGIGFGSSEYIVFRPDQSVDKEWLYYFLSRESFRSEGVERMSGAVGHKRVAKEFIESYLIPVPPLSEQLRIVAILAEAFDGIAKARANAEKNLQNARALFESHLQAVFTQRGEGWVEKSLGELCQRVSVGHVGPTSQFYCEPTDGVPFLRSQNVRPGKINWNGVQYITKEFHRQLKKSQLRAGDLLFVRVGANRGDCCAIHEDVGELNCANIVFARPSQSNAAYLERYCQSPLGKAQLLGMTTGSAQGVINTSSVAKLIIPLPPLSEQTKIIGKLDTLAEETQCLESLYQHKLAALNELKKSLLHQAFSGQL